VTSFKTEREARVWNALGNLGGQATAWRIADEARLPKATVIRVLEGLERQELVGRVAGAWQAFEEKPA
jgi:DNA-binding IclR family transcriptional regulator